MPFPSAETITSCPKLVPNRQDLTRGMHNFALYTLVPLIDREQFHRDLRRDDAFPDGLHDSSEFPPEYDFSGKTMKDLVAYHIDLCTSDAAAGHQRFSYEHLIIVVHEDYLQHGVLIADLINSNYDETDAVPGLARCPLQSDRPEYADENTVKALSWCVNLQIANMDFFDLQQQEENIDWPSEIPGLSEVQHLLQISDEDLKKRVQDRYDALADRVERYSIHHVGDTDRDTGTMTFNVEPDDFYKEVVGREQKIATTGGIERSRDLSDAEHWELIRRGHPARCSVVTGPLPDGVAWAVHKVWMFVHDRTRASGEGVALVKAHWDGVTKGKSKEELDAIMPRLEVVERCATDRALRRMDEISGFNAETGSE